MGGFFTATEAATIAVIYSIVISMFVYRTLPFRNLMTSLVDAAKTTGMVLMVVGFANLFTLVFEGGRGFVRGTIVSDGTILRHRNTSCIYVFGALYVSPTGKLIEKDYGDPMAFEAGDTTARSLSGSIVCLGKTNSESKDVVMKPVAAVIGSRQYLSDALSNCEVFTDSIEELYPDPEKYFREEEYAPGASSQTLSVLFDNGAVLYASGAPSENGVNYTHIFGLDVRRAVEALDEVRK